MSHANVYRQLVAHFAITTDSMDFNGREVILDADADTSITADTDDQIDIKIAGNDDFRFGADIFSVLSGSQITVVEDSFIHFGGLLDGGDILFSGGDADNEAMVFALDNDSQALHVTDIGAKATDWNISGTTHPNVYIHSNTTPATDYLRIGGHTGTAADIDVVGGTTLNLQIAGTTAATVTATGFMVDQATDDTAILSLRSTGDVVTGMTTLPLGPDVTTNDFFTIGKAAGDTGGTYMTSVAESTVPESLHIECWGGAPATTDTSSSLAAINIFAGVHNNANADGDMAANSNALVVGEIDSNGARLTRMLLKADDGELHLGNTTLVALDAEDDVQLVRAMQTVASSGNGIVPTQYDGSIEQTYNYDKLHELGIVGPKDEDGFFLFKVQSRFALAEGAIWQLYNDMVAMAAAMPESARQSLPERIQKRLALTTA